MKHLLVLVTLLASATLSYAGEGCCMSSQQKDEQTHEASAAQSEQAPAEHPAE